MADEPSLTRWSFLFGRKREPDAKDAAGNGETAGEAISNGNEHLKGSSDMAIYEQYRSQNRGSSTISNGVSAVRTDERPQKPLFPTFESAEMRTLAESLSRDIIRGSPDVTWESIKGLESAKRLLKEAVVMPIKYPKSKARWEF